jgi:hypothetical protein
MNGRGWRRVNVPNFPPACLTSAHTTHLVKATRTTDLDTAIRQRVLALALDQSCFVLGLIRCSGSREAVIVSQCPLGATDNIAVSAHVKDKGRG